MIKYMFIALLLQCAIRNEVVDNSHVGIIYFVVNDNSDSLLKLEINGSYYLDSANYVSNSIETMALVYNFDTISISSEFLNQNDEESENCKVYFNLLDSTGILIYEPDLVRYLKYSLQIHNECNFGQEEGMQILK